MDRRLTEEQEEVWDRLKNGIHIELPDNIWWMEPRANHPFDSNGPVGTLYFNTTHNQTFLFDGTEWRAM